MYPLVGSKPEPPLLQDDAPFLVDGHSVEGDVVRPVLKDEQRRVDHRGIVGGNLQFVHGFIEARVCIDVRAKPHAERLHEAADFLPGEMQRTVEAHVLGLPVRADVIAQAIRERADRDKRIDRNGLAERGVLNAGDDGRLLRAGEAHGHRDR